MRKLISYGVFAVLLSGAMYVYHNLKSTNDVVRSNNVDKKDVPNSSKAVDRQENDLHALRLNCSKYAEARELCASAANYGDCMELRGSNQAYVNVCTENGSIR